MLSLQITGNSVGDVRSEKARALREFIRSIRSVTAKLYQNSADEILQSLQKARLNENDLRQACLTEDAFLGGHVGWSVCRPACSVAAAAHHSTAARCYAAAAVNSVALSDLDRAFKYFRRAARHCHAAAEISRDDRRLWEAASEYAFRAATLRQHLAKRRLLRRKLKRVVPARFR